MTNKTKATLSAVCGYGIFGFSFLFSKTALEFASPFTLLSIRFTVAFLAMNLVRFFGKIPFQLKGKPMGRLLVMGLIQPVFYFICETYGVALTSSSFAGIIIGMAPVFGLIFGAVFLKEKCTAFRAVCTVLSVFGAALTTTGGLGNISAAGFLFLLAAVSSTSGYVILSRSMAERFSAFERTYVMFALGSAVFTVIAVVQNLGKPEAWLTPAASGRFWISLLYLAVVSSVAAFLLINFSVDHISAGAAMIYSNCSTVVSVLAGVFLMGDRFEPVQIVGVVIGILSVFGVSVQKEKPKEKAE